MSPCLRLWNRWWQSQFILRFRSGSEVFLWSKKLHQKRAREIGVKICQMYPKKTKEGGVGSGMTTVHICTGNDRPLGILWLFSASIKRLKTADSLCISSISNDNFYYQLTLTWQIWIQICIFSLHLGIDTDVAN